MLHFVAFLTADVSIISCPMKAFLFKSRFLAAPAFKLCVVRLCRSSGLSRTFLFCLFLLCVPHVFGASRAVRACVEAAADSVRTDTVKTHTLGEATVKATRLILVTRKDTVIYDLDAVKLKEGATLGDALRKMPGMTIKGKQLHYMGKPVDRLLVNGLDFSRDNPNMALEALPAYIVKTVKTFERKGELARVAGVDDGSRERVVDVLLRRKYMGTWTGELHAAGGIPDLYRLRGYANTFADRYRVSLFANANDLNEEMWYNGDGSTTSSGRSAGKNAYHAPGGTMLWRNGTDEEAKGYLKIEVTGDYNDNTKRNTHRLEQETLLDNSSRYTATGDETHARETRAAGHLFVTWRPTATTYVTYQGDAWRSRTADDATGSRGTWNANPFNAGYAPLDSVFSQRTDRASRFDAVARARSAADGIGTLRQFNQYLIVNQKLNAQGANLTWQSHAQLNATAAERFTLDGYHYFRPGTARLPQLQHRFRDASTKFHIALQQSGTAMAGGETRGAGGELRSEFHAHAQHHRRFLAQSPCRGADGF